jgi:LysM repeat protein
MLLCLLAFPSTFALASTYTVAKGDSLYQISQRYHTPVDEIRAANNLNGDLISPGQQLNIPERLHTVQEGDNLYSIGLRYGVSFRQIMLANGLKNEGIYPGQALRIPAGQENVGRGDLSHSVGVPYSDGDLDLLARLITAEADSESYLTKVAVGAVVLNRVKSPLFPNTMAEVIYQVNDGVYQFAPVKNGFINRLATPDSIRAAKEALNGSDPSGGALYFFETWVPSPFLQSLPVSVILDSFTFAHAK